MDMIERVARAIEATMFAPHELPLLADLHQKYLVAASAAIEAMPIDQLLTALRECADDLEAEVSSRYKDSSGNIHPALEAKYWRDMRPVCAARAAIACAAALPDPPK